MRHFRVPGRWSWLPPLRDLRLMGLLFSGWVFDAALHPASWWLCPPACLILLFGRRRHPFVVVLVLAVVSQLALGLSAPGMIAWAGRVSGGVAALILGQTLVQARALVGATALLTVYLALGFYLWSPAPPFFDRLGFQEFALPVGFLIVGAALAGRLTLEHKARLTAAFDREAALRREQRVLADHAAERERTRLARDMHDVIGYRIGNIVMLATSMEAEPSASRGDVRADAALIRQEGRAALQELRDVFHVLGAGTAQADSEGLDTLGELVRTHAHATGNAVRLHVDGHPELLLPTLQIALRRIVQEGLANAAKHAPGAAVDLSLACTREGVHLEIRNGPPLGSRPPGLPDGGIGLVGVRERARALGGTFEAGPVPDGGFRLRCRFPLRPPDATGSPTPPAP
ncbi:sensor histidine kinase [Streptomyces sp. NPDC057101]|uniref:sensor histidine kinase n=1 Tax=Streptomyces sp. NPDC057101 TaxID=3346020 RepID=UPI00362A3FC6